MTCHLVEMLEKYLVQRATSNGAGGDAEPAALESVVLPEKAFLSGW